MKTAEEVLSSFTSQFDDFEPEEQFSEFELKSLILPAMKEYARIVATQVRQECAEKAKAGESKTFGHPFVRKDSILSIDLEKFIL
jgi:hypothetical protein